MIEKMALPSASASVSVKINIPVGTIVPYPSANPPNGWLLCDGRPITSTSYPALYALLQGTLPDLRSRFVMGAGNVALKSTGGEEKVTLTEGQMPSHRHYGFGEGYGPDWWPFGSLGNKNYKGSKGGRDEDNYYYGFTDAGESGPHDNVPPYYALYYIIKY